MTKWDKRFLQLAELVSSWSKDPSTKVGACIVDKNNRVVSHGYNGFPIGVDDSYEYLADREQKLQRTIHAEPNAILFAQRDLTDHILYVFPFPPCTNCAALIIQSGIKKVVAPDASAELRERWADSMAAAEAMFDDAGVELMIVNEQLSLDF
ncbi:dCMP deaminase family protein [Candidatus Pacearchaeota archaeon]|nr:dCMP deaminase family protein [Candidatus Pacearchaeota archaeon]